MRVLLIEDERRLIRVITKGLVELGHAVDTAYDGEEGQFLAETETYNLIILDLILPKKDGITICKELRSGKSTIPILMLTAKSSVEEKVEGLDSGADDYMVKPFSFLELHSRMQALARRNTKHLSPILQVGSLILDPLHHVTTLFDKKILLTPKEFSILEFLMRHADEVVTRSMIIDHVWDYNFESMSNIVDVYIASLRKKNFVSSARRHAESTR